MRDIFWGAVIIAIGLLRGDSVFRGDFSVLAIIFDALGTFFIIRGLVRMNRARQNATAQSSPPPSPPPPTSRRR